MRRREFILGLVGAAAVHRAKAQDRTRRVGVLLTTSTYKEPLETTLKERGWVLGRDLQIEYRFSRGDTNLSRRYARELIALNPDVLVAVTNTSMAALQAEGSTLPTVFAMVSDPVGMNYVDSFSRPGRNVTGFTPFEPSLGGKWVSLLKELVPGLAHIGIVYNPEPGNNSGAFRSSIAEKAKASGIVSLDNPTGDSSGIERLILSVKDKPNGGLIFLPDAITAVRAREFVALVARCNVPAIYPLRLFCVAGGLMSYGINLNKLYVAAASYVDRVLRGAKPAELPVQEPTEFELIINQTTAKQLGLAFPTTLLARADEVLG